MHNKLTLKHRIIFTAVVTILMVLHLLWDFFHDGVPNHHILHRQDLPSISNWWGAIILPLITWFLLYRIQTRIGKSVGLQSKNSLISIGYRILGALVFGLIISFSFSIGSELPSYMMIAAILIAFFIPLYLSEFLLGYILGTAFTFGVIIPLAGGSILALISLFIYKVLRAGILYLISKMRLSK